MSEKEEVVEISICGQELRLRLGPAAAENARAAAEHVDSMIRERKKGVVPSDLRAAVMTAFELAFDLQNAQKEIERLKTSPAAARKMDSLLQRIDEEMQEG